MKKFRLALSLFVICIILITNLQTVSANTNTTMKNNPCAVELEKYNAKQSSIIQSNSGNIVYEIENSTELAKELNIPLENENGQTLHSIAYSYTNPIENGIENTIIPESKSIFSTYTIDVTSTGESCGAEVIRSSYYEEGEANMVVEETIKASFNVNVGFGLETSLISSNVGFNVESSYTVKDSYTTVVPKGKIYNIKARTIFNNVNFNVIKDPLIGSNKIVGTGVASKPIGVCFLLYK